MAAGRAAMVEKRPYLSIIAHFSEKVNKQERKTAKNTKIKE